MVVDECSCGVCVLKAVDMIPVDGWATQRILLTRIVHAPSERMRASVTIIGAHARRSSHISSFPLLRRYVRATGVFPLRLSSLVSSVVSGVRLRFLWGLAAQQAGVVSSSSSVGVVVVA